MKQYYLYLCLLLAIVAAAFTYTGTVAVTGKVLTEKGLPVVGATVREKGASHAVNTDANGEFSTTVSSKKSVLIISAVGFGQNEIRVGEQLHLVITLRASNAQLQEVVVVGYGAMQKKMKTGNSVAMSSPTMMVDRTANEYEENKIGFTDDEQWRQSEKFSREGYDRIVENRFLKAADNPLSTFSIDVDAASYSNVRRMLNYGQLPPAGAVRIEELINYFSYEYPQPTGDDPFNVTTEIAACPWNMQHRLVSIGLQGRKIPVQNLPPSNLTFLIDVSGSMESEDKLPLVKSSLKLLTDQLREQDRVSIVVYAGNAGVVLSPTPGNNKTNIKDAIARLEAGGSTAGGQGIKLAYKIAREHFIRNGNNRVILCTDGDFNVGTSSDDELERLIEEERKSGVFLTVLGYGTGNYQDAKMQKLADKGNGNHAYIDNQNEARKVLVNEFGGTLFTIAKDVKLQIEFNPAKVQAYRLIGYENRMLAKEDFNNDKKDAGELGSGHTVTALYEVMPVGVTNNYPETVDALKYSQPSIAQPYSFNDEMMNIKLRYKQPDGDVSKLMVHPVMDSNKPIGNASENFRFAASIAQFGMILRNSEFKNNSSFDGAAKLAASAVGVDKEGYRKEFLEMIAKAKMMAVKKDVALE